MGSDDDAAAGAVNEVVRAAVEAIRGAGGDVVEVEIPNLEHHIEATSQYVARTKHDINEFLSTRTDLTLDEIVARGQYHPDLDLIDAVWRVRRPRGRPGLLPPHRRARGVRARDGERHGAQRADALIYPSVQVPPPSMAGPQGLDDADVPDEHADRLADLVTRHHRARGLHARRPAGRARFVAAPYDEATVFRLGYAFEQATGHRRAPEPGPRGLSGPFRAARRGTPRSRRHGARAPRGAGCGRPGLEALDGSAHARLDPVELVERAVGVVDALDEQRGARRRARRRPRGSSRGTPGPATRRTSPGTRRRLVVMARHALAQAAVDVALARVRIAATVTSSTTTCGASSAIPATGCRPAWMSAIEAPSLWPTRIGSSRRAARARRAGRRAPRLEEGGVRGAAAAASARGRSARTRSRAGRSPRAAPAGSRATARPSRAPRAAARAGGAPGRPGARASRSAAPARRGT